MNKKHDETLVNTVVSEYSGGRSVAMLCAQYNLPRSTVYFWIKQDQLIKASDGTEISYKEYLALKRRADKLEERISIIRESECSLSSTLKDKLFALEKLYGQYSVHALCDALEVSRGTFYNHIFRRKKNTWYDIRREEIRDKVKEVFDESQQRFGSKRIHAVLAERGIKTSPGYIVELMREMGLESIGRHSKRDYKKEAGRTRRSNILQQQFNVSEPNKVWVSDTTCFKVKEQYYYICVILDLFSRKIVAHRVSPKHSTYLITSTFKQAYAERNQPQGLTFHSDQGVQYTSKAFRNLLRVNKVVQSFSRTGTPHDNAVAEAFFSALKKEELYRKKFQSEREFFKNVAEYIVFYNNERPHGTLAYKTPEKFEQMYNEKMGIAS